MLVNEIKDKILIAMKSGDKQLLSVLRNIKNKIDLETKTKNITELEDNAVEKIVQKYVKERKESLKVAQQAKREDLAMKEQYEIDILSSYLPKVLTELETREIVKNLINNGANNIGAIMSKLGEYGNTIDKGLVSKIAREIL